MPRKSDPAPDELDLRAFAGAGLQFAVAIVLFVLLGQWLDKKFDSAPVFLIAGVFIGGGAAFYSLYSRVSKAQKADDERRKKEHAGEGK